MIELSPLQLIGFICLGMLMGAVASALVFFFYDQGRKDERKEHK